MCKADMNNFISFVKKNKLAGVIAIKLLKIHCQKFCDNSTGSVTIFL